MNVRAFALRVIAAGIAVISTAALTFAGPPAAPSLSEVRDRERQLEARKDAAMHSVEERLQTQMLDGDSALMERSRINSAYTHELQTLKIQEDQAYRALDAQQQKRSPSPGERAPTNSAIPRFQSQTVITYPQGEDSPSAEGKQPIEGRQKNVGLGTRELEF